MLRCLPLALLVPALAFGQDSPAPVKPLARGKDHMLHALRVQGGGLGDFSAHGLVLVHTRTDTGLMVPLVHTGTFTSFSLPMGIDTYSVTHSRLVGVLVDDARIYAATWTARSGGQVGRAVGRPFRGTYRLLVFRRADGKALHDHPFGEASFLDRVLPETTAAGPLTLVPGGVRCLGTTFTFAGDKLKATRYEKAKDTKKDG